MFAGTCGPIPVWQDTNRISILTLYETNASSLLCHTRKRPHALTYTKVNDALQDWYLLATFQNVYPAGPKLGEKAQEIFAHLEVAGVKGTNSWLEK